MGYFSEIFQRADLHEICDFLLFGSDGGEKCSKSYMEQLDGAYEGIHKVVCEESQGMGNEEIFNKIMEGMSQAERVHMEIGLRCGFKLALQLMGENGGRAEIKEERAG